MENLSIFDMLYEEYKINKPIRLIEFFAGYGSQALALKYLGVEYSHHKICEWAIPSIIAYADLHRNELETYGYDFTVGLAKSEIAQKLCALGVSIDYNNPATYEKLKRVSEDTLRLCYNSIIWTHNLVDISRVKGDDLGIENTNEYTYLLTYSFPCQDLSLAGRGAGMEKGSGTRSGLLWEVERILSECKNRPQILLMENVPQVHGSGNDVHFKQWQLRLEEMGYKSYWEDMTAVDYGIPQSRNRTFMVSVLGDYNYRFPRRSVLSLRLADLLEKNVDSKFDLSEKLLNCFMSNGTGKYPRRERFLQNVNRKNQDIGNSITTAPGQRATDNFIVEPRICASRGRNLENPNSREKGQKLEQRIELGPEGVSNTLTTVDKDNYLIEPKVIGGIGEKKSNGGTQWYQQDRVYDDNVAISVTTSFNPNYIDGYRFRKLTPRELFRLMGLKDEDIDLIMEHQTNAKAGHLAGDSIVTTCIMAIISKFYDMNWRDKFNPSEWWRNE